MGMVIFEVEWAVLGVNFGRPIVTNEAFVSLLCESDALFSNYFEGLLYMLPRGIKGAVAFR